MGDGSTLKPKKGRAREQLLEMARRQARVQGKSLVHYLRELQVEVEDKDERRVTLLLPSWSVIISGTLTCRSLNKG